MEILSDEMFYVFAAPKNAEMPFAKNVDFQAQQKLQRVEVLAAVREQGRVEGAVDVLAEQHGLFSKLCGVHQRTGRVAGAVVGGHLAAAHRDGFPLRSDLAIDPQRHHTGTVPGGGGDLTVTRL